MEPPSSRTVGSLALEYGLGLVYGSRLMALNRVKVHVTCRDHGRANSLVRLY